MDARPKRRSTRLQGYDYSRPGAYFVSICTQDRKCLFGDIENQEMALNDAGRMLDKWYVELENKFQDIRCDEYIIMPNHFHAIIQNIGSPLHRVIQWFKTMTTNEYNRGVKQYGWLPFPGRLWQRNDYDRIVRNGDEISRIRQYIRNNPAQWATDKDNPFIEDKDSCP